MPANSALLVTYGGTDSSYAWTWQRVLYPRPVLTFPSAGLSRAAMARLRARYRIQYAVATGSPPVDPGFARMQDLGNVPGSPDRVWFGPLSR